MIKKILNLPTDDSKIYKQILAFLNFSLNATSQEREVLAEIMQLNNEYEPLAPKQRAKFILSTDMRKETREKLEIEEKQFNVILSRLKKKSIFGESIFDEDGILSNHLLFKPDREGIRFEINLMMSIPSTPAQKRKEAVDEALADLRDDESIEPKVATSINTTKIAPPANGTDNIIEERGLPSGFVILPPNE
jgi:hypothetical protein